MSDSAVGFYWMTPEVPQTKADALSATEMPSMVGYDSPSGDTPPENGLGPPHKNPGGASSESRRGDIYDANNNVFQPEDVPSSRNNSSSSDLQIRDSPSSCPSPYCASEQGPGSSPNPGPSTNDVVIDIQLHPPDDPEDIFLENEDPLSDCQDTRLSCLEPTCPETFDNLDKLTEHLESQHPGINTAGLKVDNRSGLTAADSIISGQDIKPEISQSDEPTKQPQNVTTSIKVEPEDAVHTCGICRSSCRLHYESLQANKMTLRKPKARTPKVELTKDINNNGAGAMSKEDQGPDQMDTDTKSTVSASDYISANHPLASPVVYEKWKLSHSGQMTQVHPPQRRKTSRGLKCVVPYCQSYQYQRDYRTKSGHHFFKFPRSATEAQEWKKIINLPADYQLKVTTKVCSLHFKTDQLESHLNGSYHRKPGAAPCIFPPKPATAVVFNRRRRRPKKTKRHSPS